MIYIAILFIFIFANDFFYIIPDMHVRGVFRVSDLGIALILILLFLLILKKPIKKYTFTNNISILIFCYLLMVLIHAGIASIHYSQSIFSGLIMTRHQFYYLSYFVFLLALDEKEKIEKFMEILTWLSLLLLIFAVLTYIGLPLIHHKWAESESIRSGIKRAYIPGLNIIGLAFIWHLYAYVKQNKFISSSGINSGILLAGLFFRQTRGRIIAACLTSGWILIREKRLKLLISVAIVIFIVSFTMGLFMKNNIILESFQSSYAEINKSEGTWGTRVITMQHAMNTFLKHPIIGSGALLLRDSEGLKMTKQIALDSWQADLGYVHWLKNFGLLGALWLITLTIVFFLKIQKNQQRFPKEHLYGFAKYQFLHILISNITIDYFARIEGILILTLTLAIGTRINDDSFRFKNIGPATGKNT